MICLEYNQLSAVPVFQCISYGIYYKFEIETESWYSYASWYKKLKVCQCVTNENMHTDCQRRSYLAWVSINLWMFSLMSFWWALILTSAHLTLTHDSIIQNLLFYVVLECVNHKIICFMHNQNYMDIKYIQSQKISILYHYWMNWPYVTSWCSVIYTCMNSIWEIEWPLDNLNSLDDLNDESIESLD